MDAQRLSLTAINEAIASKDYVVTSLLSTGEVTIAILTGIEQTALNHVKEENVDQMIETLKDVGHHTSQEFKAAFEAQMGKQSRDVCPRNNLIIRHLITT
ncbi:hypothetical protein [Peribacillus asahii]|uniref:hypothetical protein n=1 Tax=Peribacillus asahii TaxID=228899 RepID=UPI002079F871|nr:hypothetical protein [Peribacillus asahii]USK61296.1 hypothetical protein LIT37_08265 [Peribacillus asahii]